MLKKILSFNQRNHHFHHHSAEERFIHRLEKTLDLDLQQQACFITWQTSFKKASNEVQQIRQDQNEMLEASLSLPVLDKQETQRLMQIPRLAMDEQLPLVVSAFVDFHESLTDEQREQLGVMWKHYHQNNSHGCH
jgi:hypothetical protein